MSKTLFKVLTITALIAGASTMVPAQNIISDFGLTQIKNAQVNIPQLDQRLSFVAVNNGDGFFNKTYLIGENGKAISSSFAPQLNFNTGDNFFFGGKNALLVKRDSYNPYGAPSAENALLVGSVNYLLSIWQKHRNR